MVIPPTSPTAMNLPKFILHFLFNKPMITELAKMLSIGNIGIKYLVC